MLNIFESYSTKQNGINQATLTDFSKYINEFQNADTIFVVWGVSKSYKSEKEQIIQLLKNTMKRFIV